MSLIDELPIVQLVVRTFHYCVCIGMLSTSTGYKYYTPETTSKCMFKTSHHRRQPHNCGEYP